MMHIGCLNFVELSVVGKPWPVFRPYPATLSSSLFHRTEESKMEKIIEQGKDREITYQLPPRAKQCQQLPVKIDLDSEKQAKKD